MLSYNILMDLATILTIVIIALLLVVLSLSVNIAGQSKCTDDNNDIDIYTDNDTQTVTGPNINEKFDPKVAEETAKKNVEAISTLASMYNKGEVKVTDIDVTNAVKSPKLNVGKWSMSIENGSSGAFILENDNGRKFIFKDDGPGSHTLYSVVKKDGSSNEYDWSWPVMSNKDAVVNNAQVNDSLNVHRNAQVNDSLTVGYKAQVNDSLTVNNTITTNNLVIKDKLTIGGWTMKTDESDRLFFKHRDGMRFTIYSSRDSEKSGFNISNTVRPKGRNYGYDGGSAGEAFR
jgi:hypothetical protein